MHGNIKNHHRKTTYTIANSFHNIMQDILNSHTYTYHKCSNCSSKMCIHPQICILCCSSHKRLLQYIAFLPALHVIRFKYNINVVEPKYGHSNHTGQEDSLLPVSAIHGQWQLTSAYHTPEPQHVQGLNLILFSFFFIHMPFLG